VFDSLKKNLQVKEEVSEVCTNSIVNEVLDEVKQNYTDNISLHEMAQDRNVSQGYLSNLIKKESGMTFSQHLTRLRINKSKEKLTQTNLSILEVAELVGYSDYYYFIKVFKKEVGITPFQFKKMNRA
jgi:two-component system response regulator YesN